MKNSHIYRYLILILLVFIVSENGFGQKGSERNVNLDLTIIDYYGRYVADYDSKDVDLYVKKTKQEILSFAQNDEPMSIGILIDSSGSMQKQMDKVKYGLVDFLNGCNPENEYFMLTFNERIYGILDFTTDANKVFEEIKKLSSIKPKSNTALLDTLIFGQEKLEESKYKKRVLIIIGDGQDNHSKNRFKNLLNQVKRKKTLVYSVGLLSGWSNTTLEGLVVQSYLDELANKTGGKSFYPYNLKEVKEVFGRIAEELRNQYTVKFKLDEENYQNLKNKNKGLKLKVKLKKKKIKYKNKKGKEKSVILSVRHRKKIFLKS